ncbi:MAG: PAS domain S-box protein [Chlorobi bacterium]|nr:PAS domain S-box protein [Chlorobiota bacterium]
MSTKSKKIFIVDDIEENIQVLNDILEQEGTKLSFAQSGKEALYLIPKEKPDLILLDIFMPEMDGFEVCEKLKANKKTADIPVIFLTAGIEIENIVKGFELGAVDYITKPFNSRELISRVNTHIGFKKARDYIKYQKKELERTNNDLEKFVEQLAESEKKFNDIFEFSPLPTIIICEDKIVMANKIAVSFFEATNKHELLGKNISSFIYTDSKQPANSNEPKILEDFNYEGSFYRKITTLTGKIKEIEASEIFYKYQDKPALEVVFKDITEKLEAKRTLDENNRLHSQILDGFTDAVYISNYDYDITYLNKAMRNKLGYDATGEKCHKAIYNLNGICKWCTFNKLKNENKKENEVEKYDSNKKLYYSIKNILLDNGSKLAIYHDITKYKFIEKEIRKSERYFRKIYDNTPYSILSVNRDLIITDANLATLYLFELKGFSEIINNKIDDLWSFRKNDFIKDINNVVKSGKEIQKEYKFSLLNRKVLWLNCYLIPVKNSFDKVEFIYLIIENVSEKKANKEQISKLSTVVEQSSASIVITNIDGDVEYVNPNFYKITGYNADEIMGKNLRFMQSGKTSLATYKELWETIISGKTWEGEFINKRKNGEEFWDKSIITPIKNEKGTIINYAAIKEDITELKLIQQKLISSEQHFRMLYEHSPLGILTAATDGTILNANKALVNYVSLNSIEDAKKINVLKHPIFKRTGFASDFIKCLNTGKSLNNIYNWKSSKGKSIFYLNYLVPIKEKNGKVNKAYIIVEDVTERIQAEKQLQLKNEELELTHKSILSSINYAKIIQKAVLPTESFLKQFLPESFVLYMPRNIVSGDFYWIKQVQHKIFIAAADCTGHGVPGAFLSMLGMTLLSEIISSTNEADSYKANQILNNLRKKLKLSLHQDRRKDTASDGMDIALAIIDIENKEIQYAGANNPLFIIRNNNSGNKELLHYKPDRMPIGVHLKEKSFTNHQIQLMPDDLIYLFSDGFIDQFGGMEDRKYLIGKFKEFLLVNSHKPLDVQKQLLKIEFEEWKGKRSQVDDILIMGMKIHESYGDVDLF